MKTGLTPAESMVVNGGERSNATLAGTIETELSKVGAVLTGSERIPPLPAHPCGTQGIPVPQRDKTFLAKGPATPPAALPTVITSRYKTARPLHAPPIVK